MSEKPEYLGVNKRDNKEAETDGSVKYRRDEKSVHYMPKRRLEDIAGAEYGSTRDLMALESDFVRYFNGRAVDFRRYELDFTFSTGFQKRVWLAVLDIPYGRTMTYKEVAARMGEHNAVRSVGNALNGNPLPILIPCHRVVGVRGVGGFSGGPALKKRMLKMEGVL